MASLGQRPGLLSFETQNIRNSKTVSDPIYIVAVSRGLTRKEMNLQVVNKKYLALTWNCYEKGY